MFLFASKSGSVIVADPSGFISVQLEGIGRQLSAIVLRASIEPKPVVQIHGSVGGENYLNVFGEDATIIRISGVAVGDGCQIAQAANSAVQNTVEYFRQYSVLGRAQPITYRLSGNASKRGYLVAITVNVDGEQRDVAAFEMVVLSEPLVPPPGIISLPSGGVVSSSDPGLTVQGAVSLVFPVGTITGQSSQQSQGINLRARQFALDNSNLLQANGELSTPAVITSRDL